MPSSPSPESPQFQLLALPIDLRLMIYERIPSTTPFPFLPPLTKHSLVITTVFHLGEWKITLTDLNYSILGTCRSVNEEATPIFTRRFGTMISYADAEGIERDLCGRG
jgi:hypothetical protein